MPRRGKKHLVKDYNVKDNIVTCICGNFTGTAEEFSPHRLVGNGKMHNGVGTLDFLLDMKKARSEYYLQGSTGFYIAAKDVDSGRS